MKIVDARTYVVANPAPYFGGYSFVFVKLITDSGVEGLGEVYGATFSPNIMARLTEDLIGRRFIDRDPFRIERTWREAYADGFTTRPDVTVMAALSAIEIACWDIIGKELGRPIYDLMGGKAQERLRTYTYLYRDTQDAIDIKDPVPRDPVHAAERAAYYVEQGFTALKFDPFGRFGSSAPWQPTIGDLEYGETYIKALREAVGTKCDLLLGTHGQFTPSGAIRVAERLAPYDLMFFEEPVPPEMPEQMALVAARSTIPVAAGERLTTKYEFARLLELRAAAILQLDLGRVGGLLEAKKIAGMAEAHYAQLAPHLFAGPVNGAANIQLSTCSPNFLILEGIEKWGGFHAEIVSPAILWEDGYVIPPDGPGLGVVLNEELALANPYEGGVWPPLRD
jgi:2-dehydro-3-deoxyphosphogalactonate aldolase